MSGNGAGGPSAPAFDWRDPLGIEEGLNEQERLIRDTASGYAEERLMPRVLEAHRHERFDPEILREMGGAGPARGDPRRLRLRWGEPSGLRARRARDRAGRQRLPLGPERTVEPGHVPDPRIRQRVATAEVPARPRHGHPHRVLRVDRARRRLRSRRHDHPGAPGRGRLRAARRQDLDQQRTGRRSAARVGEERAGQGPRLPPGNRHAGARHPPDRGQVLPAGVGDRPDPHGRRVRPGRERATRGPRG